MADFGPERSDLRPEKPNLRPERLDLRPKGLDLRSEGPDGGGMDERTNERKSPVFYRNSSPSAVSYTHLTLPTILLV